MADAAKRPPGRPVKPNAKRNDPNMVASTVLLNKRNKTQARFILAMKTDTAVDLSDLCNILLAQWIQQQEALDPKLKRDPKTVVRLREVK